MMLPIPINETVTKECADFDRENALIEDTLRELWDQFPSNTDVSHVFAKVIVLNELYKTRIFSKDLEATARHIAAQGIDPLLEQGSHKAVDCIWGVPDVRRCYSFATKYCSWQNPMAFPIFDRYVDESLWAYKKQAEAAGEVPFSTYERNDVWDYEKFFGIVSAFRDHYQLAKFTFKELDKFLWRVGNGIFKTRGGRSEDIGA